MNILNQYIDTLITDEVRALSIRSSEFVIAFTPKGKELKYNEVGNWQRDNRQIGKPARICRKLLKISYKDVDWENFNNLLKNEVMNDGDFEIVEGSDITKYYNEENYFKNNGSLGSSCMRYNECAEYFRIYEDYCQMLVCIKNDKILGRAILWNIDDKVWMDRIYTCDDYLVERFIEYAKQNKWMIRGSNRLLENGDQVAWLSPNDNYNELQFLDLYIEVKPYFSFPYLDSFRYYDIDSYTISTSPNYGTARLCYTNGCYEMCTIYTCASCGQEEVIWDDEDYEMCYCEYLQEWYCPSCCYYSSLIEDYVPYNTKMIEVIGIDEHIDELPYDYVEQKICLPNRYTTDITAIIFCDHKYYYKNCFIWSIDEKRYIHKQEIDNED